MPIMVGVIKDISIHFLLWVSFRIVKQVVEHGQCIKENNIVLIAVIIFHPLSINNFLSTFKSSISKRLPCAKYAIIMIGTTISFAGNPRIKANNITPSIPKNLPNGSKKFEQCDNNVASAIVTFAITQIRNPAGIAIIIALLNTNNVRSQIDLMITLPI